MIETLLLYVHSALLLLFGIVVCYLLANIPFHRRNCIVGLSFLLCSGILQILVFKIGNVEIELDFYSLIVHLPLSLLLYFYYKRSPITIVATIATTYMLCQPANWVGLIFYSLTKSTMVQIIAEIVTLFDIGIIVVLYFAPFFSKLFSRSDKNTIIFGLIPVFYYLLDYLTVPFLKEMSEAAELVLEFMPLFVCLVYLVLSSIYYKEHELNLQNEKKDHIVQITLQQQARELELMKEKYHEVHLLRHDMRLLMNNLALSIQNDDKETALKLVSGYTGLIDETKVNRYCKNDTINYVLSNYADKCEAQNIRFETSIQLSEINTDEILFSSILSNALDNALNATRLLDEEKRHIRVMIKDNEEKLLLSVRNTYLHEPVFKDGIPVTSKKGHGYGTQSIRYMTEKLGGNLQFSIKNEWFILRVIL